jgi:nucleoside-diphosphate-sugar epimerase
MILVTGASGLIGAALVEALAARGAPLRAAFRSAPATSNNAVVVGDIGPGTDWTRALDGVSVVAHLAGPAHAKHSDSALHRAIAEAAGALAAQAARVGAQRFIFVSSIKAACARTRGAPVREADAPAPADSYGRAKLAAEQAVLAFPSLQPVVVRPPLVIAPNAKGNFARLLRLADSPLPLPLGAIANKRSVISLASLVAALMEIIDAPSGPGGVFHVTDAPALSSSEMLIALREGMGRRAGLFRLPGFGALAPRALSESLEVDASKFAAAYAWRPGDARAALAACAAVWSKAR